MNSYFDQIEQTMGDAVARHAHKPWHRRLVRRIRRHPGTVVGIAVLVGAAPAVGAVTHWYGLGAANHPQSEARAFGVGNAIVRTARVLTLRVRDPAGGPPWGIRFVRTQQGSCDEIGRVDNDRIGSLGIDGYWHDDHLFHPYPASWVGGTCSSGSTVGGGGSGVFDASANTPKFHAGAQSNGCQTNPDRKLGRPACPQGSLRIIMTIALGSTVKSIIYRTPAGNLQEESSPKSDGTFLLVFPLNATTCRRYLQGHFTSRGTCEHNRAVRTRRPFATPLSAAIKSINLRNGKSCAVVGPALLAKCSNP